MNEPRMERKFTFGVENIKDLKIALKTHPMFFRERFHERTVNNIYFDTPGLDNFLEGIEGVPERSKIRVRWYDNDTDELFLEIKGKKGTVGDKLRYKLQNFHPHSRNLRKEFLKCVGEADIPETVKAELKKLIPLSINYYRRKYYESQDKKFRITLDYDLFFKRILSDRIVNLKQATEKLTIMEIKYQPDDEIDLPKVLKHFPIRLGKFSKYNRGVRTI